MTPSQSSGGTGIQKQLSQMKICRGGNFEVQVPRLNKLDRLAGSDHALDLVRLASCIIPERLRQPRISKDLRSLCAPKVIPVYEAVPGSLVISPVQGVRDRFREESRSILVSHFQNPKEILRMQEWTGCSPLIYPPKKPPI